jgi:nucleotide-binding universal stress UspA family protein
MSVAKAETDPRPRQAKRELAKRTEEITTRVADLLRASRFSADSVVHFGNAHTAMVEKARDWSAELIVISSHYNGVTQGWVADEHTRWVLNHAPGSVKVLF